MKDIILRLTGLVLLILLPVGGFLLWKHYRDKKLQSLAYKEYEINKLISVGNYSKAREIIKSSVENGSFRPLLLSYELYIKEHSEERVEEGKVLEDIIKSLKDEELRAYYRERYAYYLFREGKAQQALKELEGIREGNFNYVSALLLRVQILQREGKEKEAQELLKKVKDRAPGTYFANMAQVLETRGN